MELLESLLYLQCDFANLIFYKSSAGRLTHWKSMCVTVLSCLAKISLMKTHSDSWNPSYHSSIIVPMNCEKLLFICPVYTWAFTSSYWQNEHCVCRRTVHVGVYLCICVFVCLTCVSEHDQKFNYMRTLIYMRKPHKRVLWPLFLQNHKIARGLWLCDATRNSK